VQSAVLNSSIAQVAQETHGLLLGAVLTVPVPQAPQIASAFSLHGVVISWPAGHSVVHEEHCVSMDAVQSATLYDVEKHDEQALQMPLNEEEKVPIGHCSQ
jgi:hypothetical protein